jgi:exoribonuclease R
MRICASRANFQLHEYKALELARKQRWETLKKLVLSVRTVSTTVPACLRR